MVRRCWRCSRCALASQGPRMARRSAPPPGCDRPCGCLWCPVQPAVSAPPTSPQPPCRLVQMRNIIVPCTLLVMGMSQVSLARLASRLRRMRPGGGGGSPHTWLCVMPCCTERAYAALQATAAAAHTPRPVDVWAQIMGRLIELMCTYQNLATIAALAHKDPMTGKRSLACACPCLRSALESSMMCPDRLPCVACARQSRAAQLHLPPLPCPIPAPPPLTPQPPPLLPPTPHCLIGPTDSWVSPEVRVAVPFGAPPRCWYPTSQWVGG